MYRIIFCNQLQNSSTLYIWRLPKPKNPTQPLHVPVSHFSMPHCRPVPRSPIPDRRPRPKLHRRPSPVHSGGGHAPSSPLAVVPCPLPGRPRPELPSGGRTPTSTPEAAPQPPTGRAALFHLSASHSPKPPHELRRQGGSQPGLTPWIHAPKLGSSGVPTHAGRCTRAPTSPGGRAHPALRASIPQPGLLGLLRGHAPGRW
jgi:hypothetical protein